MPELPGEWNLFLAVRSCAHQTEVERARKLIAESLTGYKIVNVDAQEDKIVYTGGTSHKDFVRSMFRFILLKI
jgi:L-asparaginase II